MATVGARLRRLRLERGLTQTEVTGGQYSKEYVSQVELGKTAPSRKAIKLFAKYLDVDESYFETGIDLEGRDRFESLVAMGELLIERRDCDGALRSFDEARSIGEKAQNPDFVWRAETGRAWALHRSGREREAVGLLAQARAYYEDRGAAALELAVVLYRLACAREMQGDLRLALLLLEESLKVAARGVEPADHLRVRAYRRLASVYAARQDLAAAREAAEKALDLARGLDDPRAVAEAYWEAALTGERQREFARATEYAQKARDILADLGDKQETAKLLCDLGGIKNKMGLPQEAIAHLEEGLAVLRTVDDPVTRSALLNGVAEARLQLGDTGPCLEAAAKSLAIMEGREDQAAAASAAHLIRARAFLLDGRLEEGRREVEAAKSLCEGLDAPHRLSGCLLAEGDLMVSEGRISEAAETFRRSSELAQTAHDGAW